MNKIKCQAVHDNGCSTCGGYGHILEETTLICGHKAWFRPEPYTTYDGKRITSRDGLECVQREDGLYCAKCDEI